jgi:putative transposase
VLREQTPLGSQMVCNAIFAVCKAYKSQKSLGRIQSKAPIPKLNFQKAAVHFDHRTYSLDENKQVISLYTLDKRLRISYRLGERQRNLLLQGKPKEAELVFYRGQWYFNLVIELPAVTAQKGNSVLGVDIGENNLAATSTGKLWGGGLLINQRDRFLAHRRRLQSNGSESAKQRLCKVSGKERRHVQHVNHEVSKAIVKEAQRIEAGVIVLEDLTHIRSRIKAGKRMRSRLHRWAFRQLQTFIAYKALGVGIGIKYINPAYTSQTCSDCDALGRRQKHRFTCSSCGLRAHADCNASRNIARIAVSAEAVRATVN